MVHQLADPQIFNLRLWNGAGGGDGVRANQIATEVEGLKHQIVCARLQIDVGFGDTITPRAAVEELPTILDFGRGECIPCQKMMPVLDMLADRHEGRVVVRYLDLSDPANLERATAMRVSIIPTQILVAADGTEVDRHQGFWALDAIEARMGELGWTPER